jgi:hypothetical protein
LANLTNQVNDINPGIGPKVGSFDTGNGFGTRVFWVTAIPDRDLTVNLATGTAALHVRNDPEYDYDNFADSDQADWNFDRSAAHPHGFFNALVNFDVVWNGPVTQTDHVKDTANGFAGTFYQNDATVTWSASSTRPVGNSHFTFTSNPGNTATSNGTAFVQLGTEQNGIFFPSGASLQPDPVHPALTDLVVEGSSTGGVDINVLSVLNGRAIRVTIDGGHQHYQADFPAAAIARLLVNSGPGNNHIAVAPDVRAPALLFGDYGNDQIEASGGPSVLVGGEGDDHLVGGAANDLLIGGIGSDHLEGHAGSDILIAGTTNFDNNLLALRALLAEWSRPDESYLQRVANISGSTVNGVHPHGGENGDYFLSASTVQDDGVIDTLDGGAGLDWYFANLDGPGNNGITDRIRRLEPGEIVTHIAMPGP